MSPLTGPIPTGSAFVLGGEMPAALPTRAALEQQLLTIRARLLRAERRCDIEAAQAARDRCDEILDQMLQTSR